jgi:NAD(P)H-hydrate epimerase
MGDVLSGILGGFIAQGLALEDAAQLGATIHACAADLAAEKFGQRGLIATDIIPFVRELLS